MRDPVGKVEVTDNYILRHAYSPLDTPHFLDSLKAKLLIERRLLTPFSFENRSLIRSKKIKFVTYPWEWTHNQFIQAATVTLDIAELILNDGYELKDASAFNIIFEHNHAEFCDHFSIQSITHKQWWAYGQFLRHFIFPLALSRYRGIEPSELFKVCLDGVSLETARKMLSIDKYLHRIFLSLIKLPYSNQKHAYTTKLQGNSLHHGLLNFLRWQLAALNKANSSSIWTSYENERNHYQADGLVQKHQIVANWLSKTSPSWVVDLGCNQGEFSLIASKIATIGVVAIDGDIASIERLRSRLSESTPIFTVCNRLDDLSSGRGWLGEEYPSLLSRINNLADLTMALAIIHHLAIDSSIPLAEIAKLMSICTKHYLIIEYIELEDPMVQQLLLNRNRIDNINFTISSQRKAFSTHFRTLEEIKINGTSRWLALLERL